MLTLQIINSRQIGVEHFFLYLIIRATVVGIQSHIQTWLRYEVGKDGRQFAYYLDDSGVFDVVVLIAHYTTVICRNYQPLCHAALAYERFTAFAFPHRHSTMWKPKVMAIVLFMMLAAATFLTGFPSIFLGISYANLPSRRDPDNIPGWDFAMVYCVRKYESGQET